MNIYVLFEMLKTDSIKSNAVTEGPKALEMIKKRIE